ncbi:unnamed protein product [Urochloa humidicola]
MMYYSAYPKHLLPPTVIQVEPSSSDWKEYRAIDGSMYYLNKKTGQSVWEKPVELMDPLERADSLTEWEEFCTPLGHRYYYNKVPKQSEWCLPNELKAARELVEKASNFYQTCKEKKFVDGKEKQELGGEMLNIAYALLY